MIEEGSFVTWNPANIEDILCETAATALKDRLPLPGIMSRIDGAIGRMAYMQRSGQRAEITVRLSEVQPVGGMAHV